LVNGSETGIWDAHQLESGLMVVPWAATTYENLMHSRLPNKAQGTGYTRDVMNEFIPYQ